MITSSRTLASAIWAISVMPTPAATRPCLPSHSVDSKAIRGSKPASPAAARSVAEQLLSRPSIQARATRAPQPPSLARRGAEHLRLAHRTRVRATTERTPPESYARARITSRPRPGPAALKDQFASPRARK
jgi:hypothetical protein